MDVIIWGSRGSLPVSITEEAIKKKIRKALKQSRGHDLSTDNLITKFIDQELSFATTGTYGGNTACVEFRDQGDFIIFDSGTGIRDFGNWLMASQQMPVTVHIFISHLHWDHMQGFPFFVPAYIKGNTIKIYGCHEQLEQSFIQQQDPPGFPVPFDNMQANIEFINLSANKEYKITKNTVIKAIGQNHPGKSYGYRLEKNNKIFVYSTDCEHTQASDSINYPFINFFRGADLLIMDAQYTMADATHTKETWGHSSNLTCIELANKARAKHLCMFHTEPTSGDEELEIFLEKSKRYADIITPERNLEISLAYDGLTIEL
jgi:phosphoribosyl 1,2-cyclic phosphodiesterase